MTTYGSVNDENVVKMTFAVQCIRTRFTLDPRICHVTRAVVCIQVISTCSTVLTGYTGALIDIYKSHQNVGHFKVD